MVVFPPGVRKGLLILIAGSVAAAPARKAGLQPAGGSPGAEAHRNGGRGVESRPLTVSCVPRAVPGGEGHGGGACDMRLTARSCLLASGQHWATGEGKRICKWSNRTNTLQSQGRGRKFSSHHKVLNSCFFLQDCSESWS